MDQLLSQIVKLHRSLFILSLKLLSPLNRILLCLLFIELSTLEFIVLNPALNKLFVLSQENVVELFVLALELSTVVVVGCEVALIVFFQFGDVPLVVLPLLKRACDNKIVHFYLLG